MTETKSFDHLTSKEKELALADDRIKNTKRKNVKQEEENNNQVI